MSKPISEKKLAANRSNGEKSRGTKSPESRFNAVKSGLTAESVVITAGRGKEDIAEFEAFYADVFRELAPVGFEEQVCVEDIIKIMWRLRRGDQYETGCIRMRMKSAQNPAEIEASRLPEGDPLRLTVRYQGTLWRRRDKLFERFRRLQRERLRVGSTAGAAASGASGGADVIELKRKVPDGHPTSTQHDQ